MGRGISYRCEYFLPRLGGLLPRAETGILSKGYLWVDFFFLLSGFIISHVYSRQLSQGLHRSAVRRFLWARFTRLYPLHLFTLLIFVIAVSLVQLLVPEVVDGSWGGLF